MKKQNSNGRTHGAHDPHSLRVVFPARTQPLPIPVRTTPDKSHILLSDDIYPAIIEQREQPALVLQPLF
jgi:hypothetical protein